MDLSTNRSQDEDRIMQRQLYRAGQNQAAQTPGSGPSRPSSSSAAKPKRSSSSSGKSSSGERILLMILLLGVGYFLLHGTPSQRRKTWIGLGVAAWLLMLGSISYCLSLPNLEALSRELNQERMAIFQDTSLTPEQRREKFEQIREKEKNLTPAERKQMRKIGRKEMTRKMNKGMYDFLKLSPAEQVAQLKKEAEERQKRFEEMRKMWAKNGGQKGNRGNGPGGNNRGGPPGGGPPGGWGGGGGGGNAGAAFSSREDSRSPEARAGGMYKMGLMQQMGIGPFGRGGPGGGGGGGKGGGR